MGVRKAKHGWVYSIFFGLLSIAWVFPIVLVLINSFKKKVYISRKPFEIPTDKMFVKWDNYINGMEKIHFFDALRTLCSLQSFQWRQLFYALLCAHGISPG